MGLLRVLAPQGRGELFDFRSADPLAGSLDEAVERRLEGQFQLDRNHPVVEVLDAGLELFAGSQSRRRDGLLQRGLLEAHVIRRRVFEAWLARGGHYTESGAQLAEINTLGDVVEKDGPQGARGGMDRRVRSRSSGRLLK